MKKRWRYAMVGGLAILILGAGLSGTVMSQVEQPAYKVVRSWDDIELRDYQPMIVAEVLVPGERKEAINAGLR